MSSMSHQLAASLIAVLTTAAATAAQAETMSCRANVALNRVYEVTIDLDTADMVVTNDAGTRIAGRANQVLSGRTGNVSYFLAAGFGAGVDVEVESGAAGRVAMCLAENECYLCRR